MTPQKSQVPNVPPGLSFLCSHLCSHTPTLQIPIKAFPFTFVSPFIRPYSSTKGSLLFSVHVSIDQWEWFSNLSTSQLTKGGVKTQILWIRRIAMGTKNLHL